MALCFSGRTSCEGESVVSQAQMTSAMSEIEHTSYSLAHAPAGCDGAQLMLAKCLKIKC